MPDPSASKAQIDYLRDVHANLLPVTHALFGLRTAVIMCQAWLHLKRLYEASASVISIEMNTRMKATVVSLRTVPIVECSLTK